jgi:hypothetical protein
MAVGEKRLVSEPEVDEVKRLHAKPSQRGFDLLAERRRGSVRQPRAIVATADADLRGEDEAVGIGVKRFGDQLVGDAWAVEASGID